LTSLENSWYLRITFLSSPWRKSGVLTKIIIFILLIFIGATFCTLNQEEITLRYLFGWQMGPFPLFLLILGSLAVGLVLGFLIGWGGRWKLRAKGRDLDMKVKALREEMEALTNQPKEIPASSSQPPEEEKLPPA
jgi:uncharacterized integral membrane protein